MSLQKFIKEWEHCFSNEFCDRAIQTFKDGVPTIYDTPGYKFNQISVNACNIDLAYEFCNNISELAEEYFIDLGLNEFIPEFGFEQVRIKEYNTDSEFKVHVDAIDKDTAKRFLVFILYLDDNEGGGTEFPTLNTLVSCNKGKLVCFPSTWQYPHAGLKPIKKSKYIMMTYLNYI